MSFSLVRVGEFQFNFREMKAYKIVQQATYERGIRKVREVILSRYWLADTRDGLMLVMSDSSKKVRINLDFLSKEAQDEVLRAWTDWVFERDLLRG